MSREKYPASHDPFDLVGARIREGAVRVPEWKSLAILDCLRCRISDRHLEAILHHNTCLLHLILLGIACSICTVELTFSHGLEVLLLLRWHSLPLLCHHGQYLVRRRFYNLGLLHYLPHD